MSPRLNRLLLATSSMLALLLAGCGTALSSAQASAPGTQTPAPKPPTASTSSIDPTTYKRQWMLVGMPTFRRNELEKLRAQTDWSTLPAASAHMGCNQLRYNVTLAPGDLAGWHSITISPIASTRMMCADTTLENMFVKLLPTMRYAKVEGHRLILRKGEGQTLQFVAADWD